MGMVVRMRCNRRIDYRWASPSRVQRCFVFNFVQSLHEMGQESCLILGLHGNEHCRSYNTDHDINNENGSFGIKYIWMTIVYNVHII